MKRVNVGYIDCQINENSLHVQQTSKWPKDDNIRLSVKRESRYFEENQEKMSHIQYVDELVKEYLLFRGFSQTLKAFDNDLKAEKEKGFRVSVQEITIERDKIYVNNAYEFHSVRETT